MPQKVLRRCDQVPGAGLRSVLAVQENPSKPSLWSPPNYSDPDLMAKVQELDSFLLDSFTAADAWELGHFLYAHLLPFAAEKPTLISISVANSAHVLFQTAVGAGTMPDNDIWVQRKRNTVLRFGTSTFFQNCKYANDEAAFLAKFQLGAGAGAGGQYAIHGGGVPIRVAGVEGIVAVVVVSGLKHWEDHGVVIDVIQRHYSPVV